MSCLSKEKSRKNNYQKRIFSSLTDVRKLWEIDKQIDGYSTKIPNRDMRAGGWGHGISRGVIGKTASENSRGWLKNKRNFQRSKKFNLEFV